MDRSSHCSGLASYTYLWGKSSEMTPLITLLRHNIVFSLIIKNGNFLCTLNVFDVWSEMLLSLLDLCFCIATTLVPIWDPSAVKSACPYALLFDCYAHQNTFAQHPNQHLVWTHPCNDSVLIRLKIEITAGLKSVGWFCALFQLYLWWLLQQSFRQ